MRVYMPSIIELSLYNSLCLGSVDSISIEIGSPNDPAFALSPAISPSDQSDIVSWRSHMCETNIDEPWYKSCDPFVGF